MPGSVIVSGARTPIGLMNGSLREHSAVELGARAMQAAVRGAGVDPGAVEAVLMGHAIQAGSGSSPARQAAAAAGLPLEVVSMAINKCGLSGLSAVALADQLISTGQHDVVIAGGMESMTSAPALVQTSPSVDSNLAHLDRATDHDALRCAFDGLMPAAATEFYQSCLEISREEQDEFAALSHHRAADAMKAGRFDEEIVAVTGSNLDEVIDYDEGVNPGVTRVRLAQRPTCVPGGTITTGSSAPESDGACALLMMSRETAERMGLNWIAEVGAYGVSAGSDASPFGQTAAAARDAMCRADLSVDAVDLFEFDEAFASIAIETMSQLDVKADRVNVNGGSIAFGHPVAMTGARLVLTLAMELHRRGSGVGVAAAATNGGQGDALLMRLA